MGRGFYQGQRVDKHTLRVRRAIANLTQLIKNMNTVEKIEFVSNVKHSNNYEAYAKNYMLKMLELASKKE